MNKVDLDKFYQDTFSLARTMIIKMSVLAERDNLVLANAGYPVSSDKTTWRYYMNLNGDYHPTDDLMTISSIDTGEEIAFNKANLVIHLATRREYAKGGYWYRRLTERYPHQIPLINGILSPIPYTTTIAAEDYKILSYNQSLVLWNEDQLIPKLQRCIKSIVVQTFNHEYTATDDLFLPVVCIQHLYADIVKAILAIRLEDAYTRHTHEFFIWSHIDSFGNFSQYKDSLTKEQTMWLFRNIAWIKNNPGQQYTLNKMMHNLLTKAGIPLAKYDMVETTETQLTDLTPTPLYRRLNLNLISDYGREASFITTAEMIDKQQRMARDNFDNTAIYLDDALSKGTFSLHSEVPTKVLESSMKDYTNRHLDTLMTVAYNEWIYLAGKNYYNGKILVTDPKTGKSYRFPVGDAYVLWRYLIQLSHGNNLLAIEPAEYKNVLKLAPPSVEDLIAIGGPKFIGPLLAQDIRNLWFPAKTFISPDYLIEYSTEVYDTLWKHKKLYSQFYDLNKRARVRNTVMAGMYESGYVSLTSYQNYDDLFKDYELDFTDYTGPEAVGFAWAIFKVVTGWDSGAGASTRTKQDDLIKIMLKLSSYTIQVVKTMDDGSDQIELINETFVGDSRWIGQGNELNGDFRNVQMDVRSNLDGIRDLTSVTTVNDRQTLTIDADMAGYGKIQTNTYLKSVDLSPNLLDHAIKFYNNDYIRLVPDDNSEILVGVPPTYYLTLDNNPDGIFPLDIPATNYGTFKA